MDLPDRTVRTKMQGLAFPLKEEMLRAATTLPSSSLSASTTSTSQQQQRPRHSRGKSFNFSELPASATTTASGSTKRDGGGGFKSTFLRKTKSNQSLRNSTNSSTDPALKSSHGRTPSSTTASSILFRSFGKSGGAAIGAEARREASGNGEGEEPSWWAERIGQTSCADLAVKELGRLRGRLRNEAPG